MEIIFTEEAEKHLIFWKKAGDKKIQKKIQDLIADILLHLTSGAGKPEALKYDWSGYWSRRINVEHRLIYKFSENEIRIYSLKGHY